MGRAGLMSGVIFPRWLSEGMDDVFAAEPELFDAYDLPPYPDEMAGEGDWIKLYKDDGSPFAILWYAPETESVGIELGHDCHDTDLLTTENLRMRVYKDRGLTAQEAFNLVAGRYNGELQMSNDLAHIKMTMVVPTPGSIVT